MTVLQYHRLPVLAHQHRPISFCFLPVVMCGAYRLVVGLYNNKKKAGLMKQHFFGGLHTRNDPGGEQFNAYAIR